VVRRDQPQARYGPVMAYASLVISLLALVVAGASVLYARRQSAAQARATIIEDDRRHDELTPVFEASCEVAGDPGDSAKLKIALAGGIDALDQVVITIQDGPGMWPHNHGHRATPDTKINVRGMFQRMITVRRTPTSSIAVVRWRPLM
jgi:hypothetical protein